MNDRQAVAKGYSFTGSYSHDRDGIVARKEEIIKAGHKAVLVYEPSSPLSRSNSGGGYSIYAAPSYFDAQKIESLTASIQRISREELLLKQAVELRRFDEGVAQLKAELAELQANQKRRS